MMQLVMWVVLTQTDGGVADGGVAGPRPSGDLVVEVRGLRTTSGMVECRLWAGPSGFPRELERGVQTVKVVATEKGTATCVFAMLAEGHYAVTFHHDENGNGVMDTGLFGIPREPWGVSRNPSPFARAPRWSEASFEHPRSDTRLVLEAK